MIYTQILIKNKWLKCTAFGTLLSLILTIQVVCDRNGPVYNTATIVAENRAYNACDPDEKVRNPDYLAAQFLNIKDSCETLDFSSRLQTAKQMSNSPFFFVNARTHHIDMLLKQEVTGGVKQVVVLGAGLDSRAYRFKDSMPRVHFFEVDLPEMQNYKKERVQKIFGKLPANVTYAPIDFNKQTLKTVLGKAGYKSSLKTYFIFEGVTMYISEEGVSSTMKFIAQNSARGSSVVFDYFIKKLIKGDSGSCPDLIPNMEGSAAIGEPWIFGMEKDEAEEFVNQHGLKVLSNFGGMELTKMYLVRSDSTVDYWISDCWRMMHAGVK